MKKEILEQLDKKITTIEQINKIEENTKKAYKNILDCIVSYFDEYGISLIINIAEQRITSIQVKSGPSIMPINDEKISIKELTGMLLEDGISLVRKEHAPLFPRNQYTIDLTLDDLKAIVQNQKEKNEEKIK